MIAENFYIGGDGSSSSGSSSEGWNDFASSGGMAFVSGIVSSFLGFGATVVQGNNSKDIAISKNNSDVKIHESDNSAKTRISEIWAEHSREITSTIIILAVIIALLVYMMKGNH